MAVSSSIRLRQALLALSVVGSLTPGVEASPQSVAPAVSPEVAAVAVVDLARLRGTWDWPLTPRPVLLTPFRAPASTYGAGHRGIDMDAGHGQVVRAVDAGVVTHVGVIGGRGTVSVTHPSGVRSTYEPVRGTVSRGSSVGRGETIGTVVGRSHCGGACLHLGALVGATYVDPRPLLGTAPVILLPLGGWASDRS